MTAPLAEIQQTLYRYAARPIRAVDGDTIEVTLILGFNVEMTDHVRLFAVNTPELVGEDAARAREAKAFTAAWLADASKLYIESKRFNSREKYGRILAVVFRDDDAVSLNAALIVAGLEA